MAVMMACMSRQARAQQATAAGPALAPRLSLWDGMLVAGYVGHGGYADFGGPCIKWALKPCSVALGLFPAVRIKEDKVAEGGKKNAPVVPSTGLGITTSFKHLVVQIPLFYDAKTATADGKWSLGIGLGYKF